MTTTISNNTPSCKWFSWKRVRVFAYGVALLISCDFFPRKIDPPPPLSRMKMASGIIHLGIYKRDIGSALYIENGGSYSCKLRMSQGPASGCDSFLAEYSGKPAVVYWYRYQRLVCCSGNVAAQVVLGNGKVVYSVSQHIKSIEKENNSLAEFWLQLLFSVYPVFIVAAIDFSNSRKQTPNKQTP